MPPLTKADARNLHRKAGDAESRTSSVEDLEALLTAAGLSKQLATLRAQRSSSWGLALVRMTVLQSLLATVVKGCSEDVLTQRTGPCPVATTRTLET